MNGANDAADQVVKLSLESIEVLAKISGAGAKNLAVYLYAVLKEQKKTKGKARLETMLKSGKDLKIFAVKNEDLPLFTEEAKKYGVLFCALKDKKSLDGMCDIMVKAEDGAKINRIINRYKLGAVDMAQIGTNVLKRREEKAQSPLSSAEGKKKTQSENSLNTKGSSDITQNEKPSVRKELSNIKAEQAKQKTAMPQKQKTKAKGKNR